MVQAEIDCCDNYYARLAEIRAGRTRSLELRINGSAASESAGTAEGLRPAETPDVTVTPSLLTAPTSPGSSASEEGARTNSAPQRVASSLDRYLQPQDMCGKRV